MKAEDITPDTSVGDVCDAIDRGDFTWVDLYAQGPRLQRELAARVGDAQRAWNTVRCTDRLGFKRKGTWAARYVVGGDGSKFFLVTCGRASWHVDPITFTVKKLHRR